jgi:hypothetical protein
MVDCNIVKKASPFVGLGPFFSVGLGVGCFFESRCFTLKNLYTSRG